MVILGFIPVLSFGLGTWQVQRLRWKVALIEELQEKMNRDPMSLPKNINLSVLPEFTFRKVVLRGTWDVAHAMLVGPRARENILGYDVVMPLVRPDGGSTILVNRGFVSRDMVDQFMKVVKSADPSSLVEVCGMISAKGVKNMFTPQNDPVKGNWFWADANAMSAYAGGEQNGVQAVLIDEIMDEGSVEAARRLKRGVPIGKPSEVDVRNNHTSYIFTWYSLSLFTAGMFWRLLSKGRSGPRVKPPAPKF
jgi:surfeit locus 1 family protein